jgi:hypothetical protein
VHSFTAHMKIAIGVKGGEEGGGYDDDGVMKYMSR